MTVTPVSGSLTAATETVIAHGAAANVTVTLDEDIAINNVSGTLTATVTDATGNPASGTVDFSAGPSAVCTLVGTDPATLKDGKATILLVAQGTEGNCVVTAVSGSAVGSLSEVVQASATTPTDPTTGDGEFASAPNFGTGNVGSAVFNGGTIAQLSAAVTASGGTAVWVQGTDGNWYRYNTLATGATAFVNNAFNAQFSAGFGTTAVFVVK